ncbi:hypothetical protein RUM43_006414 [Polyplax serrata]|uniref:Bromodomain associated domain-containing protein n=1 Tax=Polyplax serrata TaxID=468196 RepID=A0AAN8S922_POLSC
MSGLWGEYDVPEVPAEEVIPAEIVKLFIMKAMQPDVLRTPLPLPAKSDADDSVKLDASDSETLGLEMDDTVIHSIKLVQHIKEMTQLIEAAKEQTELMAESQIQTFPPALDIPVHPIKQPKHKLNHPIQYMDKESSDFVLGKGPKIPEVTTKTAKYLLKKSTAALLAHAGYQNTKESVLNILTDSVEEYITKITSLLRVAVDQGANSGTIGFPDAMERVFHEMGLGSVRCIHEYYQSKVISYHQKLLEECKALNFEYNNISFNIKAEPFALDTIDKIEEQDDVPEIHFPALGEEGVDELQPSLEPGFQMLHSLEQEVHLQSVEMQEEEQNTMTDSPSQEISSDVLQTHFLSKRKRRT